ncbi:hypothetical protein Efla_001626 [Eimeria flavescens]
MPRPGVSVAVAAAAGAAAAAAASEKTPGSSVFRQRTRKQQTQQQQLLQQKLQQAHAPLPPQQQQQHQQQQDDEPLSQHLQLSTPRLTPLERRLTRLSIKGGGPSSSQGAPPSSHGPPASHGPPSKQGLTANQRTPQSASRSSASSTRQSTPVRRTATSSSTSNSRAANTAAAAAAAVAQGCGGLRRAPSRGRLSSASPLPRSRTAAAASPQGRGPPCRGGRAPRGPSPLSVSTAASFVNLRDLTGEAPEAPGLSPFAAAGRRCGAGTLSSRSNSPWRGGPRGGGPPLGAPLPPHSLGGEGGSASSASCSGAAAAAAAAVAAAKEAAAAWSLRDMQELYEFSLQALRPSAAEYCGGREEYEEEIANFVSSGVGKTCVARHALHRALGDPTVAEACSSQVSSTLLLPCCCCLQRHLLEEQQQQQQQAEASGLRADLRDRLQLQGIVGAANRFTELSRKLCLVDEVDFLVTKGQIRADMRGPGSSSSSSHQQQQQQQQQHDALLALALAATHPQSRILVVAISNSTELSGHLSGLRIKTLVVSPYTEKEILQIMSRRLAAAQQQLLAARRQAVGRWGRGAAPPSTKGAPPSLGPEALPPLFAPAALLLFARKAANANGDVRMALSGLCRAIEEKLTELQEEEACEAQHTPQSAPSPSDSLSSALSPPSPLPREKRRQAAGDPRGAPASPMLSGAGGSPSSRQQAAAAGDLGVGGADGHQQQAAEAGGRGPPVCSKAARHNEQSCCVSSVLRKKPPLLSALETELARTEGPPNLLSLSSSSADTLLTSCKGEVTPGFPTEPSDGAAQTPQSLCSTAPSPAAASAAAAAAAAPLTPAALAKQQLRLLQQQEHGEAPPCSSKSAAGRISALPAAETAAGGEKLPVEAAVSAAAAAAAAAVGSPAAAGGPLCDEQHLLPCCTLEALPAGLLLQHLPHAEGPSLTRRDSKGGSSCVSSQSLSRSLCGLRGSRSLRAPRRASEAIGVGTMSVKASAVYGQDQQQVISRIQGLPLMQRVYLLAACRSAQKKLLSRASSSAAAASAGGGAGGQGPPAVGGPMLERRRASTAAAATSSQESRGSQAENTNPTWRPVEAGGVQISYEEVETQYRLLADELPHGYLLSGKMGSSCWRHAVESFEQMGLMVAAAPEGPCGGGGSLGSAPGLSLTRKPRLSLGGCGLSGRRSAGGNLMSLSSSKAKTQAWELQLSPALVEAAIKRLQPQLMGSDIEGHFSRGMEG